MRVFAVAAAALACVGCGTARSTAPAAPVQDDATAAREWLTRQPEGCALGQSGPTLKPTDAFREARRRARAALVTAVEKVQQKSAQVAKQGGGRSDSHHEVILEQSTGWVRRSTIVALWYDDRGTGPGGAAGTAYAAACLGDGAPESTRSWMAAVEARRAAPAWIYGGAAGKGELCALGVSGPTMDPKDAPVNAEASAREELAEALAARVKLAVGIFQDDDSTETVSGAVTEIGDAERERAQAARIVAKWSDERGVGPIPFPGTAYARACTNP